MKKQLPEFLSIKFGRLILLAMILFIGQGVAISQGTITVTTNTDAGDGSLRQAVADAVDGDVIQFSGAITTITLDSTLTLGDKTLTIDGGGDVVLNRDVVNLDSFRLVTITGVVDKVVTIKSLTIQNGYAKDGHGGGLSADNSAGGKTILDKLIFKNNTALNNGGGAYVVGLEAYGNIVTNCEFIENKALHITLGRGGALFPKNTTITGSTFTKNECGDSGGAIFADNSVAIYDSHFEENKALDDAGGAIRMQGSNTITSNCTFESNSAANGGGGAIFMAKGRTDNCTFINNSCISSGGAINANTDGPEIHNSLFIGNSTDNLGGAVYIDDGGMMSNCIAMNNTAAVNGGGVYLKGAKGTAKLIGSIVAHNTADSIGGGVYVGTGKVINSTITKNNAGKNGGALSGDGNWLLANSIVYDNDAAGDNKNIQVISNSAATAATNCAIDATGYDAAAWTASNITTLDASPFVGGSEADSLMLPTGSALIDAGDITGVEALIPETDLIGVKRIINGAIDLGAFERYVTLVVTNADDNGAGSLRQAIADAVDGDNIITFADDLTTIKVDQPLELGDSTLIIDGGGDIILDGAFNAAPATDIYRVFTITGDSAKVITIKNLTIQNGNAADGNGGAISADNSAGGVTVLENITFANNSAKTLGGGLYIKGTTNNPSMITNCAFNQNSVDNGAGEGDGGGMFGLFAVVSGCTFTENQAMDDAGAIFADDSLIIINSVFTGNTAGGNSGAIRSQDVRVIISDCTFDSNSSADEGAGAVYLARGSMYNCEITNNTTTGDGGGVYANQNECLIDNSLISGNTATGVGGGVYIDDGAVISNCIVTNNTAGTNGGGIYLKGANASALAIGCVVTNNTADAKGGGMYVLKANVINTIMTQNNAGTNGGALTGDGEWFLANSVVYANDAVGEAKNIESVSNTATVHAAYCAIDATAYDDTWTANNISVLNASPFLGGTGADSLYSASSALVDAGTVEYGIAALLPETDLLGESRIQGVIDLGPYETEIISVIGVSLNLSAITISAGETGTLVASIDPTFATDKQVTWSSSDETIATVAGGVVTGVAEGNVTITVTTVDGGLTATCDVTVVISVTGVTLDQTEVTLAVDETVTLVATVTPENATEKTVGWTSGNEDVATVDNSGLVTAIAPGSATISVVTLDGAFIAFCEVTVSEPTVAVTGITLDQSTLALEPQGTATLVATVTPEDATDKSVTWTSSDEAVATVTGGVVTAVANGTCTITATTTDGAFTATCAVTVSTVGLELFEAGFKVYPNPVQNNLFIEGRNIQSVAVYSLTGEMVMNVNEGISNKINLSEIKSGMYILKITSEQGVAVTTIIKE